MELKISDLHASIGSKEILNGLDLCIKERELHVLMGPNGSGKTTLAKAVFGHPEVSITKGDIAVDKKSIINMKTNERAALGLFLGFQNPVEIEGLGFVNFLRSTMDALGKHTDVKTLMKEIESNAAFLGISEGILGRSLNVGFSGGEKKKGEALQMLMQKPKIAILDEPDSGLDIDATKAVAQSIEKAKKEGAGILIITHHKNILEYVNVDFVHIMVEGRIVANGGKELAEKLEKNGYEAFK